MVNNYLNFLPYAANRNRIGASLLHIKSRQELKNVERKKPLHGNYFAQIELREIILKIGRRLHMKPT